MYLSMNKYNVVLENIYKKPKLVKTLIFLPKKKKPGDFLKIQEKILTINQSLVNQIAYRYRELGNTQ